MPYIVFKNANKVFKTNKDVKIAINLRHIVSIRPNSPTTTSIGTTADTEADSQYIVQAPYDKVMDLVLSMQGETSIDISDL